jgi:hypothetical protein
MLFAQIYKLETNDGVYFVRAHPTLEQMALYATKKRKQGIEISAIKFRIIPYYPPTVSEALGL